MRVIHRLGAIEDDASGARGDARGMGDDRARALAEVRRQQRGLHTRDQAIAAGYSPRSIDRHVRTGVWDAPALNVYAPAGLPADGARLTLAATLSAGEGAAAARGTAAAHWGLQKHPPTPCVVVPYAQRGPVTMEGVCLHRSRNVSGSDVVVVRDIPTTVPDRTLADLAIEQHPDRVRELMARGLQRGVTDREALVRRADLIRGKPGASLFHRALATLMDGAERARSCPELDLAERIADSGLPRPEIGYEVREEDDRLIAELDLAFPWCKLAIEVDGFVWHSTPNRKHYDEVRQNRLTLRGWRVLRFSVEDIRQRPEWVVRQIAAALNGS
ncbi:MAG: DUF559 domain-containing protein [Actinobacteria bacterium]|nr:DUF559 domain-containing protein [Actinomycetota bacterium]